MTSDKRSRDVTSMEAQTMAEHGLGRHPHFDPRNLDYLISDRVADPNAKKVALLASRRAQTAPQEQVPASKYPPSVLPLATPTAAGTPTSKYFWDAAWWGNQGSTLHCTAFASMHLMSDGPVTHPKHNPMEDPHVFFKEIEQIDLKEGRNFNGDGATSLAMAKALKNRGYIGEYLWGYSLADFIRAIRSGPVILGIDWYVGMDSPDDKGRIKATGKTRGGHEILANGCDFDDGVVRLKQSWGRDWGKNGHCYLSFEDLEKLIASGGDVVMVRELKVQ
jgi:hypothetical protein